jgi:alkanesulfonate monooxygenase SsuD/methylene tetrahydromethanopterin reductase-like flavin-dependent oxidoreductase (luciferase family)
MRIGFKTSQAEVEWPTLLATWEYADAELTVFDSAWVFDHFVSLASDEGGPCHEGWSVLAALASRTTRLKLGHLVISNTYRHPAVLAKMGATLDHIADGRFVLGLGAGWHEREHSMYGIPFPRIGERITMLESATRLVKALWESPAGVSLEAPPYALADAVCEPPPRTPGGPPVWLGTQGTKRGLRIVAEHADGWNATGDFEAFLEKRDALLRHCDAVGRDPAEIETSVQIFGFEGPATQLADARRYADAGVDHVILIAAAKEGPEGLARLAREVAEPLLERVH